MKSVNYPLALPLDFLEEFKQAAKEAGLKIKPFRGDPSALEHAKPRR